MRPPNSFRVGGRLLYNKKSADLIFTVFYYFYPSFNKNI